MRGRISGSLPDKGVYLAPATAVTERILVQGKEQGGSDADAS